MRRLGITAKLALHSAVILAALGAAVTLYSLSQLRSLLHREMLQRVEAQALNWIEANTSLLILSGNHQTLHRVAAELKTRAGIAYVLLLDAQGHPKAGIALPKGLTERKKGLSQFANGLCWREMQDEAGRRYFELIALISTAGTGMNPDLGTLFGAAAGSPAWGELHVGVDRQEFDRTVNVLARRNVLLTAALTSLAIAASFALARRMVTPITLIGKAANQIAAGNLSERVQHGQLLRDEIGHLVRNFNRMAATLQENHDEMQLLHTRLEERVSERTRALEEANRKLKELDQLKSDFISTVSHELRTPLTSIKAYAEILLDSPHLDAGTAGRFLNIIDKEANRMSRLISDLLNLEKIESGTSNWAMSQCDLQEIIRTAVAVLAPSAADKGVSLRLSALESQSVWADADKIQEVITNLIGNGVKFCSRGDCIEVRVRRSSCSGPSQRRGEYVQVDVSDNGPGIPAEERERIFEKFYQGIGKGTDRSGSGLGLAISKEIVLHHGGEIWLDWRPGPGSRFCFTLPLQSSGSPTAKAPVPFPTEG